MEVYSPSFVIEHVIVVILHSVVRRVVAHIIANMSWVFAAERNVFVGTTQEEGVERSDADMGQWYEGQKTTIRRAPN